MTVEEKALALVKKARQFCTSSMLVDVLCRDLAGELEHAIEREQAAIEAHEADKKAFSDAVKHYLDQWRHGTPSREVFTCQFADFILPKPDPLVEIAREMTLLDGVVRTDSQKAAIREGRTCGAASDDFYDRLRMALPARGYKIERIEQ